MYIRLYGQEAKVEVCVPTSQVSRYSDNPKSTGKIIANEKASCFADRE
jgi:hypothetical protein